VYLLRQRSAWNNTDLFVWTIGLLGRILAPFASQYTRIFFFDAAKIHISTRVFAACRRAGVLAVLLAASLTWLLQPLDVRTFAPYKIQIQKEYQAFRLQAPDGVVGVRDWLASVCAAIRVVLQGRPWAPAFASVGLSPNQAGMSERTKAALGVGAAFKVGAERPTDEQLKACFPKRSKIPSKAIWRACDFLPKAPAAVVAGPPGKATPMGPPPPFAVGKRLGPLRPPPPAAKPSGPRRSTRLSDAKAKSLMGAPAAGPVGARGSVRPLASPPPRAPLSSGASSSARPGA
jgi:hypothetical protein